MLFTFQAVGGGLEGCLIFHQRVLSLRRFCGGYTVWRFREDRLVVRGALIVLGPYAIRQTLVNRVLRHFRHGNLHLTNVGVVGLASRMLDRRCTRLDTGPFFRHIGSSVVATPIIVYYFRKISTVRAIHALTNPAGKHLTTPKAVHKSCDVDFRRGVIRTSSSPRATTTRLAEFFGPRRVFSCGRIAFSCLCTGSRCWLG